MLAAPLPLSETVGTSTVPVALNPFGSLFTALAWVLLLGVNFYCLWRLRHPPRNDKDGPPRARG